jgi:hypothetical protein
MIRPLFLRSQLRFEQFQSGIQTRLDGGNRAGQNLGHLFEFEALINLQNHRFALVGRQPRSALATARLIRLGRPHCPRVMPVLPPCSPAQSHPSFPAAACGTSSRPRCARCGTARAQTAPGRRACGDSDTPSRTHPASIQSVFAVTGDAQQVIVDTLLPSGYEEVIGLHGALSAPGESGRHLRPPERSNLWLLVK